MNAATDVEKNELPPQDPVPPVIGLVVDDHETGLLLGVWVDPIQASVWAAANCRGKFTLRRLRQP